MQTGYPGVVVVEGTERGVDGFLRGARGASIDSYSLYYQLLTLFVAVIGLHYLDFHHLSTELVLPRASSQTPVPSRTAHAATSVASVPVFMADLIPGARSGLREVASMKEMVESMDAIGRKAWFRMAMGMSGS